LHIDLYPDQARSVHWIKLLYYQVMLRLTSARADRLVLVSHSLEPYATEELKIPKERTRVVYSEELDPFYPTEHPAIVEVALNDGRRYTRRVDWARGTPPNPISTEELEAKFVELATTVVSKRRAGQIIDAVYGLEGMQDVSELARLLQVRE